MKVELFNHKFKKIDEPILFLEFFSKKIIHELFSYYDDFKENPLKYRERTLGSIIFPALSKASKRAAMEIYYYNNGRRNFLDYYALDELDENVYLIETKVLFLENETYFGKFFKDKWFELDSQLDRLEKNCVEEWIDYGRKTYGISLALIIPWFKSKQTKSIEESKEFIKNDFKFDWIFSYDLSETNLEIVEVSDNNIHIPWIILGGKIKTI